MLKAYKYRLYPDKKQQELLAKHVGHARHVYNWALEAKKKTYEETGKSLSKRALQDQLVLMKRTEKPWLSEVNSQTLLAALMNLEKAFINFFAKRASFPKCKKKYDSHQSFQCPQHVKVDAELNLLHLPKIKAIKASYHRMFTGTVKTVTISKVPSGKYFASILIDNQEPIATPSCIEADKTSGLDMGLTHYLISSEGDKKEHPKHLRSSLLQLVKSHQQLSRKKVKDTHNRAKQKMLLAKKHEKVANRRHAHIHQLSAILAYKNQETSFAVEDLHIKGMIRNRKLSQAIGDSGWGKFISCLKYKCEWSGKNLLTINRFLPTSKICHVCDRKREKLPLSVREWQCDSCFAVHDRDINAAKNIKAFALADTRGSSVCVKQFPCSDNVQ
jgi:putative transposase